MMLSVVLLVYLSIGAAIVLLAWGSTRYFRRKRVERSGSLPPFGFQETDEVFIDPTTGMKQRVWFNPRTGERHYQKIK